MRRTLVILGAVLPLAACGWFGHKGDDQAAKAGPTMSSDEVQQKDCSNETWKQQNLGLWYSVCRQPMKW